MSAKSDYTLTPVGAPATVGQREERATRELALGLAVSVAASQQVGRYNGNDIVSVAGVFEAYLKGDGDE